MSTATELIAELRMEAAATRALIERLPEAHGNWKPHVKSMSLGDLCHHLAVLPGWGRHIVSDPGMDISSTDPGNADERTFVSLEATLAAHDRGILDLIALLEKATEDDLRQTWTFSVDGAKIFSEPRAAVLRSFVLKHTAHHRGQLTVYLRLLDVPLSETYGPTADSFELAQA